MIQIRESQAADLASTGPLSLSWFGQPSAAVSGLRWILAHPGDEPVFHVETAVEGAEIAGFVCVKTARSKQFNHVEILELGLKSGKDQAGMALIEWVVEFTKREGFLGVSLRVPKKSTETVALFTQSGFASDRELPGYFQDGSDALLLYRQV